MADSPRNKGPALLLYAFRPICLAAASWAVIALALWLAVFFGAIQLPTRFDPLSWHIREMLFGFVMAAVSGFILIPNWTGRLQCVEPASLCLRACGFCDRTWMAFIILIFGANRKNHHV